MALTIAPDFADGIVTAAKLQQLSDAINDRTPLRARMTADQALATSSTALVNVTELGLAVEANAEYDMELRLAVLLSSGVTEDVDVAFTFPSGATLNLFNILGGTLAGVAGISATDVNTFATPSVVSGTTRFGYGLSTTVTSIVLGLTLINGSNAGTLQVQASQHTSGGNTVTVKASSTLVSRRVA